jgi:hypothetical protein
MTTLSHVDRMLTAIRSILVPSVLGLALAACGGSPLVVIDPPSILLAIPSFTGVAGSTMQASATVTDANGRPSQRAVTWRSSDTQVATVNGTGLISMLRPGETTISAELAGVTAELPLTVVPAPLPSTPASSFFTFTGTPGYFGEQERTERFDLSRGDWSARLPYTVNHVSVYGPVPASWRLDLAGPALQPLAIGVYENAVRHPFQEPDAPGIAFIGEGRGCNEVTGRFVIHDIAIGHARELHRLHATFEHRCVGRTAVVTGEIAILQYPWR